MTTIITRSAIEFHSGRPAPPELAYVESDHRGRRVVMWADVMQQRREWQAEILRWRRGEYAEPRVLPAYVWVFHNDWDFPYGGWWCYVVTRLFQVAVNFRGLDADLAESIVRAVPLGFLPLVENLDRWMRELAKRHPRRHPSDPREAGSVVGWLEGRRRFTLERPGQQSCKE